MKEIAIRENHLYQKVFRRGKRAGEDWCRSASSGTCPPTACAGLTRASRLSTASGCRFPSGKAAPSGVTVSSASSGRASAGHARASARTGFLIVIAARSGIEKRKSTEIAAELRYLFRKLDMFRPSRMHLRTARTAVSHETRLHGADPFLSARAVCTQALPYLPLYPYLLRIRLRGV